MVLPEESIALDVVGCVHKQTHEPAVALFAKYDGEEVFHVILSMQEVDRLRLMIHQAVEQARRMRLDA